MSDTSGKSEGSAAADVIRQMGPDKITGQTIKQLLFSGPGKWPYKTDKKAKDQSDGLGIYAFWSRYR